MRWLAQIPLAVLISSPAPAHYRCDLPTTNAWLNLVYSEEAPDKEIVESHIYPVTGDLPRAIALMEGRSAIALDLLQARKFAGVDLNVPASLRLKPFLVRAVFPSGEPTLRVSWGNGDKLFVFADGLGCNLYEKHPIVVFLDREPKLVLVSASAAL